MAGMIKISPQQSLGQINEDHLQYFVSSFGLRSNGCYAACPSLQWQGELRKRARPCERSPLDRLLALAFRFSQLAAVIRCRKIK
jgi:hypothetical protein